MNNSGNFEDQDPDYAAPGPSTSYQQKIYEETARTNTSLKITSIIDREFSLEIDAKEKEILEIQEKLDKALKTLHFLRYVIISDFYNRKQCLSNPPPEVKQVRLHPAVRSATGKSPKSQSPSTFHPSPPPCTLLKLPSDLESSSDPLNDSSHPPPDHQDLPKPSKRSYDKTDPSPEPPKKIPRYVPPKTSQPDPKIPSRGVRHKIRRRIVVGNISKWIPPDWREDAASHKWTMYVRASKEESDISEVVSKVRFFLHPSYRPNDVVDVTSPPFHLCRRGWGEFPLRVQLHFKNQNNKPMDIIHHLKLDRTYTGLQTLGSETVVDIWINTLACEVSDNKMGASEQVTKWPPLSGVKQEDCWELSSGTPEDSLRIKEEKPDEDEVRVLSHVHFEHDYASFERPEEDNVTIAHSPEKGVEVNRQNHHNGISSDSLESSEAQNSPTIIQNGESPRKNNSVLNSEIKIRPKIFENGSSVLQPLKITIPSHFESLNLKKASDKPLPPKIIVLKDNNDRVIKLDMNATKKAVSLLKKPRAAVSLILDPSKSIILNSSANIPVLKIADSKLKLPEHRDKPNGKFPRAKVTIGKDKTKLGSRKEFYDGILKSLEEVRIPGDVEGVMRFIIKRIPIVSPHSGDPEYRRLHPYVCGSDEEFLGFNLGKQRALEWYRAKEICGLLRKRGLGEGEIWTIKEIMLWCRLHGFTPVRSGRGGKSEITVDVGDGGEEFNSCTEPVELIEWLRQGGEEVIEDEKEVDVVGLAEEKARRGGGQEEVGRGVTMEVPKSAEPIYSYVCGSVRQIGVKLEGEEVVEGVMHDAAGRVLAKAVECLMEDLLRSSLAQSFERTGNRSCPEKISLEDVRAAVASRDEFDIFTNNGLGTQNGE
ncbi:YEATS domain-containing protein 2 [Diachasma alloeum]|uniref:YEATS domain-containing protein 2 n=1 Tax=Diachasma alloeum TaxID=454923 RepID=UPI000738251B|nr:YEATS domain-containing protein 2 [Diachasma alloeum]